MTEAATSQSEGKPPIRRIQIGINVVVQIILFAMIVAMCNYLAFRFYSRWDFSESAAFTLSEQTKRVIEQMRGEMDFILFFSAASPIYDDLERMLKEYQYYADGKISIEYVDPYRNFTRARELQSKYKFGANENVLIVDYDGRTKFLTELDMAAFDESAAMFGGEPTLQAFLGEQMLTSAMLELTQKEKGVLYYARGLGEPELGEESPISTLLQYIERQYIVVNPLDIASIDAVPADADTVLLAGARYDLSEREAGALADYWKRGGRLIVLLEPDAQTPRLQGFLENIGIQPRNDRILRTVDLQTVVGIVRDVSGKFQEGSPTTVGIMGVESVFLGGTQSLKRIPADEGMKVEIKPVLMASEGFWGETDYGRSEGEPVVFLPSEDHAPPLPFAMTAESGGVEDERVEDTSSRMLVVGNAGFIQNEALTQPNLDFLLNTLNWMVNRDKLIGIAPKSITRFNLNLPDSQMQRLTLLAMGALPGVVAAAGVMIWLKRRK